MINTIGMQDLRYLNLFEKITGVSTRFCFKYNEAVIFSVPREIVSRAMGDGGRNLRRINEIIGKRVKVVAYPKSTKDAEYFIRAVVAPNTFKSVEVRDKEIVMNAGDNKAMLIGRNKRRLQEMQDIVKDFFSLDFRIA